MNYDEFIRRVSTGYLSQCTTRCVFNTAMNTIADALKNGGSVTIPGFGTFKAEQRAARTGRNPHTGEAVPIPAQVKPVFKPSKEFIREVQGND